MEMLTCTCSALSKCVHIPAHFICSTDELWAGRILDWNNYLSKSFTTFIRLSLNSMNWYRYINCFQLFKLKNNTHSNLNASSRVLKRLLNTFRSILKQIYAGNFEAFYEISWVLSKRVKATPLQGEWLDEISRIVLIKRRVFGCD